MSQPQISPSILAADFGNIQHEVEMLNSSHADYIHIDIMDGIFVPNISFGFPVCKAIQSHSKKPLDYHLMIQNADLYLGHCIDAGAKIISVHIEACDHLHRTVNEIKKLGAKAGIALNPHTSVNQLEEIISYVDVVLVMSVNPGFGGQAFIESTFQKVEKIKNLIIASGSKALIEIDGGVNQNNAKALVNAGADILVAGNFVFKSDDPKGTIDSLKSIN